MTDDNTKTLRELLGLTKASHSTLYENTRDDLLIAIDCENGFEFTKQDSFEKVNSQLGLAILDPKDLAKSTSSKVNISTYNFATGTPNYRKRVSTRFIFGESYNLCTQKKDLAEKINNIIPDSRNVILIGHGGRQDLKAFSSLNAKFLKYPFVDTQIIARNVLPAIDENRKANESLRNLLTYFNCPFDRLHSYAPLPALKPYPHYVAFVRKQRRRQLKLQARFQDADTIARVRAERAKKREEKLAVLLREICAE
ncbi:hypothetical protein TWF173_008757 [Orbilia oligospora]|nr:hypothetical protein TWF173_008757 [Orbilia oligospora]